jgi:hypothetical protein
MSAYSEHEQTYQTRRHTNAIGLIVEGDRPGPKSGTEILDIATSTEFFEEASLETEYDADSSVTYIPSTLVSNPAHKALMEGLPLYRFTIAGTPPEHLRRLDPGTYFTFLDFIEGPDYQEGRWIVRLVDEAGRPMCVLIGVEVKEIVHFHVDDRGREEHSRPQINRHGISDRPIHGASDDTNGDETPAWVDVTVGWEGFGAGCVRTVVCIPER